MAVATRETGKYEVLWKDIRCGTKLLVKSIEWYNRNLITKSSGDACVGRHFWNFTKDMSRLCGKVVTVENIFDIGGNMLVPPLAKDTDSGDVYFTVVEEDGNPNQFCWTPEMFECAIK